MIIITSFARVMVIVYSKVSKMMMESGLLEGIKQKVPHHCICFDSNEWKYLETHSLLSRSYWDWPHSSRNQKHRGKTEHFVTSPDLHLLRGCYSLTSIWIHFLFVSTVFDKTMEVRNSKYKARSLIMRIFIQREQDVSVSSSWLSWEPR